MRVSFAPLRAKSLRAWTFLSAFVMSLSAVLPNAQAQSDDFYLPPPPVVQNLDEEPSAPANPTTVLSDQPIGSGVPAAAKPLPIAPKPIPTEAAPLRSNRRVQSARPSILKPQVRRDPSALSDPTPSGSTTISPAPLKLDAATPAPLTIKESAPLSTRAVPRPPKAAFPVKAKVTTSAPQIVIETTSPSNINVGKTSKFIIKVRNVGELTAESLVIRSQLPDRVELLGSTPQPISMKDGALQFNFGDVPPSDERVIQLDFTPRKTGPVDVVTSASFSASTKTTIQVRRPKLVLACKAPDQAAFGQPLTFKLTVSNIGDGVADNVMITPQLPQSAMPNGRLNRPLEVGWLSPGQTKVIPFTAKAVSAGILDAEFTATDASGSEVSTNCQVRIRRAVIEVIARGPNVNFLGHPGTYEVYISNPGDAPAENIEVTTTLPKGLQLTVLGKPIKYNRATNTMTWQISRLAGGASEALHFKVKSIQEGEQIHKVVARADAGLVADARHLTRVISRPNINVAVINKGGPLDVNKAANFEIVLTNVGTKVAESVKVSVNTPPSMQAVASEDYVTRDGDLTFAPMTMAIGETKRLKFRAIGREPGDHVVRVTLDTGSMWRKLMVEGSAFFYDSRDPRFAVKPKKEQLEAPLTIPR